MQRSRVDLPEPDLPSSATISPSASWKPIPSSTGSARPSGVVKVLVTPSTRTISAPVGRGPAARCSLMGCSWEAGRLTTAHSEYRFSAMAYSRRQKSRLSATT